QELYGKLAAVKILSWRQHHVSLSHVGGNPLPAKFFKFFRNLCLPVVGVVLRLGMTSRGMQRGVSSKPQHPRVLLYFLHHHHLLIMVCSCKVWFRQCRPRRTVKRHYRCSCRIRLRPQLQFPKSKAMVVLPSWRGSRGWLCPLLRGRVSPF
ncbi:hypothetical protein Taro_010510, partial [Colocasia esculenta]|nr:hypothetical protein [Colocasia esculenta]